MTPEKNKIEALLFAASRFMGVDELSKHTGVEQAGVKVFIDELEEEYKKRNAPLTILREESSFKLSVKDNLLPLVHKVINLTEFERPLMETLAVIAWKYPALQCDIIKIRHNKAYDHLRELEERGFITRIPYKRTRKITLTEKFFEYFDLPNRETAQKAFRETLPDEIKEKVAYTEKQIERASCRERV